ncbi:hypothetical protein NQ315_004640 [Exocentrus adspersus]|uniref:Mpv17-like protein 2 n=1 Tax=Exocentrus adspersus TaxID=1586481 RepID=A0AAV8VN70_9CUCU|nr:hypothetical protein NQ315_004640 [Exocentrus adspersus]
MHTNEWYLQNLGFLTNKFENFMGNMRDMSTLLSFKLCIKRLVKVSVVPNCVTFVHKAFSDKYLIFTNVGLSVLLSGVGDFIEQNFEIMTNRHEKWDARRIRNMSLTGASVGIVSHYWYYYLDKFLPGCALNIIFKKILIDQLIGSPLCISTFFVTINILDKSTKEKFIEDVKTKAWKLVLFDNSVSLGYDVYTSYVQYNPGDEKTKRS